MSTETALEPAFSLVKLSHRKMAKATEALEDVELYADRLLREYQNDTDVALLARSIRGLVNHAASVQKVLYAATQNDGVIDFPR